MSEMKGRVPEVCNDAEIHCCPIMFEHGPFVSVKVSLFQSGGRGGSQRSIKLPSVQMCALIHLLVRVFSIRHNMISMCLLVIQIVQMLLMLPQNDSNELLRLLTILQIPEIELNMVMYRRCIDIMVMHCYW